MELLHGSFRTALDATETLGNLIVAEQLIKHGARREPRITEAEEAARFDAKYSWE